MNRVFLTFIVGLLAKRGGPAILALAATATTWVLGMIAEHAPFLQRAIDPAGLQEVIVMLVSNLAVFALVKAGTRPDNIAKIQKAWGLVDDSAPWEETTATLEREAANREAMATRAARLEMENRLLRTRLEVMAGQVMPPAATAPESGSGALLKAAAAAVASKDATATTAAGRRDHGLEESSERISATLSEVLMALAEKARAMEAARGPVLSSAAMGAGEAERQAGRGAGDEVALPPGQQIRELVPFYTPTRREKRKEP